MYRGTPALGLGVAIVLASCAPVEMHNRSDRAPGQSFASTGDVILRVDKRDDLPNVFGRADLFGRTRERGFTELRYMGMDTRGEPVFRRRDVDIYTNETTMSQGGLTTATVAVQQTRGGILATGIGSATPPATVGALPPDTVQFALDTSQGRTITIQDHGVEILQFNAAGVQYRVW